MLKNVDPQIFAAIEQERVRQENELEMIASENYPSKAVLEASGSILANKYSEGYPGKRYYAGNEIIDIIENLAIDRAKQLFNADHCNVQPLSGSPANLAVYMAMLNPGDKVLGFSLDHGGHLSHGHPLNFSGKLYDIIPYGVEKETEIIDMDKVRDIALKEKPKMILAGFSAYSRDFDWQGFQGIADEIGAVTFADVAHIAGLIAGKQLENPLDFGFDVVTTTTHKTLRGPRGAIIMSKAKWAKEIDKAIFPGIQGGPHDNQTAAKAVAFKEALDPSFIDYSAQVIKNAKVLAEELINYGFRVVSGGTDNHLVLLDMTSKNLSGKVADQLLEKVGISANKNMIPFDTRKAMDPSGIRLGTPAATTRGMKETEIKMLARVINEAVENKDNEDKLRALKGEVRELCGAFPIYE